MPSSWTPNSCSHGSVSAVSQTPTEHFRGKVSFFFFKGLPPLSKLTLFECSSFVCQQGRDSTEDLTDEFDPDYWKAGWMKKPASRRGEFQAWVRIFICRLLPITNLSVTQVWPSRSKRGSVRFLSSRNNSLPPHCSAVPDGFRLNEETRAFISSFVNSGRLSLTGLLAGGVVLTGR